MNFYRDRREAGKVLADAVMVRLDGTVSEAIVLGLPRGGVPVAAEVAQTLAGPLDVLIVRKLGVPGSPEVAMGAIASVGGELAVVANDELRARVVDDGGADAWPDALARERAELERRAAAYRGARPPLDLTGRRVILVDDGIATGATMRAAAAAARQLGPRSLIAAAPVVLPGARGSVQASVDDLVCPWYPSAFLGVGQAYLDFTQTSDDEVRRLLVGGQ
ncbi:phosphoribosyltransferase [Gryllotalpicola protaetiae]|uniref:Phosphoribosyltransferase n=1 Tax=Gryllotalpicola protaetiae TaxID=2419771 RepID=A0A387BDY1_9MICO|nr:phosphoribosyltransferase family protein [Gryllotalpicola protaetiae]AYG02083.1 phosphoribosyltransferase [Gryllotalpicola protaetiae]